jgi:hypothetical protein
MAHFGKYGNLSTKGWTEKTATQVIGIGQNAHVGLWGGGPGGEALTVKADNPTVCVSHEEPANKVYANWRHFLITALQDGETTLTAKMPTGAVWASMTVKVSGYTGVHLVFFPGERVAGAATVGTIYVIGGQGESTPAAGGFPVRNYDKGGHTITPTPAGNYVLGPRIHVVAPSWPMSVIPWGAALRINGAGEAEYEASPGKWHLATGPKGAVTQASMQFLQKDNLKPSLATVTAQVRNVFINPVTKTLVTPTWDKNDFGRWGWNLLRDGKGTPFWVHTTPEDEHATDQAKAVFLTNSHGCIHLVPGERDRLMKAGYLKQGVPFEVRPYSETGPP